MLLIYQFILERDRRFLVRMRLAIPAVGPQA
jgi:hypothetical protein